MNYKTLGIVIVLVLSGVLGFTFSWYQQRIPTVEDGIPLVLHNPINFLDQLRGDKQAGKKIFKLFCASCHDVHPVIDIHAPRIGDVNSWLELRRLGMPALLKITTTGKKAMPARGGCFECSDDQLRMAIQYILDHS